MTTHPTLFIAPTRIGDAVLATSILAHILATTPNARVTIATSPLASPLFAGYPLLERIIPITKRSYKRHWFRLWRDTIGTRWGAVWDLRNSILRFVVRARECHAFTPPKIIAPKIRQYEQVLGIGPLPYPTLWPRAEDISNAKTLLPDGARYLIFAPIANWPPKEWPLAHFISLARTMLEGVCKGYRPVVICAEHEREKARPMLEALAAYRPIDLTAGDAHLLTIFACMQRADGFVGNDSGLMHMAAAARIPTLGLFGPTPHDVYQPWGEKVAYMHAPGGDLGALTPEAVAKTFGTLIHS